MPNTLSMEELKSLVADAAGEFNIPEDSIWRKIRAENSGSVSGAASLSKVRTDAVSPKDARGIMQVTQVALDDVIQNGLIPEGTKLVDLTPKDQVRVGAAYTALLRKNYSSDPAVEDAMYNFGPKARFQMDRLPAETQDYLKKSGAMMADSNGNDPPQQPTTGGRFDSSSLLSMLLGNNQQQNANIASGAQDISAVQQQAQVKRNAAIIGQQAAITGAADIAAKTADISFQQRMLGEQLQRAFNLDPSVAGNEIETSLATAEAAKSARVSARAEFDQANSVGLLDDPLQYLLNQVRLPQLAAKNNALADAEDTALNNVREKTQLLAAAKSTLVANTADQMKSVELDSARVNSQAAQAKLSEEEAKNLSAYAAQKLQLIGLTDKMGDNTRSTIGTVTSLQDREENSKLRADAKKAQSDSKALEAEEIARLDSRLKLVSDSLGMVEPMTTKRLRTLQNKKDQDIWLTAATTGQMGEDLQKSLGFYLGSGSRQGITASGGASTYLTATKLAEAGAGYQSDVERAAAATGKKLNSSESKAAGYKLYEDSIIDSMRSPTDKTDLSAPKWDKTYNPYVAPFKSFVGAVNTRPELAGLKNNSMTVAVQNLLKTDVVKGDNLTAEQQQQILGSINKQVFDRQITPAKAAADISVFISAASAWNRQMNGYTLFSLPNQESYLFTADGVDSGSRRKLDLMNPATLENAISKSVVELNRKYLNPLSGTPFGALYGTMDVLVNPEKK